MTILTSKELGKALKDEESVIEVTGDLTQDVIKIKTTETAKWEVAADAITSLMTAAKANQIVTIAMMIGGFSVPTEVLGVKTALVALSIAMAADDMAVLHKLRIYRLETISDTHIVLSK